MSIVDGELIRVSAPQGTFVRGSEGRWKRASVHRARLETEKKWAARLGIGADGQLRQDKHLPAIAALLDAFPHHEERVVAAIDAVDATHPVACALLAHKDVEVSGRRFEIVPFERYFGHIPFAFSREAVTWDAVEEWLRANHAGLL